MADVIEQPKAQQEPKRKYDPSEWKAAYDAASQENDDENMDEGSDEVMDAVTKSIQEVVANSGGRLKVSGIEAMVKAEEQRVENFFKLVEAELGEETLIRVVGDNQEPGRLEGQMEYKTKYYDLLNNKFTWEAFKDLVSEYKRRGDYISVRRLLSIFDNVPASQLKKELEEEISKVDVNLEYEGFDVREGLGGVRIAEKGTKFDLLPGVVDFREYVKDGTLDVESIVQVLFQFLASKEVVYAQDWDPINFTLNNIQKKLGSEVQAQVWNKLEKMYRVFEDKKRDEQG